MPLLNYTTKVNAQKTVTEVMGLLVAKGADEISIVYDDDRQPAGLKWTVQSPRLGRVAFALPCNIDAVFVKLTEQRVMVTSPESRRRPVIRTSWRILKDWVEDQMVLLETGMVTMEKRFPSICAPVGRPSTRPWWPDSSRP